MGKLTRKILSLTLALTLLASMATIPAFAEGEKLWTETLTADGWIMVTNEGGATLGYSPNSGLALVEADGYAFKDLNRNGQLDTYEDWRVDYGTRARDLVETENLSVEFMMGLKMNAMFLGSLSATELADNTKTALDLGHRYIRYQNGPAETVVGWNNLMQEYVESIDSVVVLPTTFIADPLGGKNVSKWPGYLGLAASFDSELAAQYGEMLSKEWRALGLTMKVAPQIDLATEPRWSRVDMTFGEDPQLSMDMSRAIVNAWQSSYDEEGNDLGWGANSVNVQIKHLTGDGAAEGGRESHTADGAFNVFPGGQFYTGLLPFIACLDLPGKTGQASAAMTNMSIAVDAYGEPVGSGLVGSSYDKWKLTELWRETLGFEGYILPDFMVHNWNAFGVEDMTVPERLLALLEAGCDAFGGLGGDLQADIEIAMEAYALGVEKLGQEAMDEIMIETTVRTLVPLFNVGVVDNPYLSEEKAKDVANNAEHQAAGFNAQVRSIVMLKNSGGVIRAASEEKQTVYIPWKYTAASGNVAAAWAPTFDLQTAMRYFNVVTDKIGTATGEAGEDGKATYTEQDIIRAASEEISTCDFALVRISSPQNANPTVTSYREDGKIPEDFEYLPISLQYRPYTADSMYVRFESLGGFVTAKEVQGTYGIETVYEKENRSYYGKTGIISNEGDLDHALYAASVADKVVVAVDVQNSMVFSELEGEVDAIVVAWSGDRAPAIDDAAFLEIISGQIEPSGLLPMQMPANMETVEAQYEDVPRDMECHVDADGNTYDFTFGLNWSGVINDERVAKYNVDPIVGEDPFQ